MALPPADNTVRECKSHCPSCDSCFSSDEAFDAHRRGEAEDRYCEEPQDATHRTRSGVVVKSLEVAQPDGRCSISDAVPRLGRVIYRKTRPEAVSGRGPSLSEAA